VICLARSSLQYQPARGDDEALRLALIRLAKQYGRYGYRKIAELLRIEGWKVNHKRGCSCRNVIRNRDGSTTRTARSSGYGRRIRTTSGASTSCTTSSAMVGATRC